MRKVAKELLKGYSKTGRKKNGALLLLLRGDLGAGKTTFVQALASELGICENITSPTFVIQKQYTILTSQEQNPKKTYLFKQLIHIDAYRLESFLELKALGWDDFMLDSKTIVALEWPDNVKGVEKHKPSIEMEFLHAEESTRKVLFDGENTMC